MTRLAYGSVCSGIEAATVAWHGLGWKPSFFSEIEPFPRAVLQNRWPSVALHGDFTTIQAGDYDAIDLLVGGTPCQSFSLAGLRGGLADDRGNLALEYLRLAQRLRPRWLVWENVPGVMSSNGGGDFGSILGGMVELGYGFAYRVLDAQYFGVPQRRRRVFLVGYLGDWRCAAAVLFERHSLQGHSAPRRKAGQDVAGTLEARASTGGFDPGAHGAATGYLQPVGIDGGSDTGHALTASHTASGRLDPSMHTYVAATITASYGDQTGQDAKNAGMLVAHTLRADGFDASEDGTGRGTPLVPVAFDCKASAAFMSAPSEGISPTLRAMGGAAGRGNAGGQLAVTYPLLEIGKRTGTSTTDPRAGLGVGAADDPMFTLQAGAQHGVGTVFGVRRLTPRECERLQGFPDDYTQIPWRGKAIVDCPDGPRYKALGNSMAVPVMAWIGSRIAGVDAIISRQRHWGAA